MGKNKLAKFAEMATFTNVIQPGYRESLSQDHPLKGRWNEEFFRSEKPITVELGCGRGEYTVGLARQFPERHFIGADIKGARIFKGAKAALDEGMSNVAFLRTHIEMINRFFGPDEISEIWLTFPDPQEKNRRRKKRLTGSRFLMLYRHFLKPGGFVNLKTDNALLFNYTCALVNENNFPVQAVTDDLYQSDIAGMTYHIRTYYEQMFLNEGKKIHYLKFSIAGHEEIREPEEF